MYNILTPGIIGLYKFLWTSVHIYIYIYARGWLRVSGTAHAQCAEGLHFRVLFIIIALVILTCMDML